MSNLDLPGVESSYAKSTQGQLISFMIKHFFISFAVMFAYLVVVNDLMDWFHAPADSIFRFKTKYSLYFVSIAFAIVLSIGNRYRKKQSQQDRVRLLASSK